MTDQININDDSLELLDVLEIGCELSHYDTTAHDASEAGVSLLC